LVGGTARTVGLVVLGAYAAGLTITGAFAALRFRSVAVGALTPVAVVATQAAYIAGFARGLLDPRRAAPGSFAADSPRNLEA
jgi:hypothetical protein